MTANGKLRLGVNIDHVATVRNARGSAWPDPLRAALLAEAAGADVGVAEGSRGLHDGVAQPGAWGRGASADARVRPAAMGAAYEIPRTKF